MAGPHQTSPAATSLMGTNPPSLDQTGLAKSAFHQRFCLTRDDGQIRIYRRRNERYTEACTLERDQFGSGGSVMVWGGVSQLHRTELVIIAGNQRCALQGRHPPPSCSDFLQDWNVSVLPWPAKSPDLNPIEHVWDLLDRRVTARAIPHRNVRELAWWKSGVTSHTKNWQFWCSP